MPPSAMFYCKMKPFNNFGGDDSAVLVVGLRLMGFVVKKIGEKLALCGLDLWFETP